MNSGYENDCGVFGSYFSHPCDQTPGKSILRKEGFVLADSLRDTVQHSEKDGGGRQTRDCVTPYLQSRHREKTLVLSLLYPLCPFSLVWDPSPWTFRVGRLNLSGNTLTDIPCVS